jgi:hypothetical protein
MDFALFHTSPIRWGRIHFMQHVLPRSLISVRTLRGKRRFPPMMSPVSLRMKNPGLLFDLW